MADKNPRQPNESFDPATQTGENKGKIKQPQPTDERNLPRGSEPETRGESGGR